MRIATLLIAIAALFACSCPAGDGESAPEGSSATQAADSTPRPRRAAGDEGLLVWHDPVLTEPMRAFARQVFISLAEDLALEPAALAEIAALKDEAPEQQPHIVIIAEPAQLARLAADGIVDETTSRTFAGDRLVLVEQEGAGFAAPSLFDVYRLKFNRLGYLADTTALGKPSRQALVSDGLLARIEERTEQFSSTAELFGALLGGEIELAVLPASLATQSQRISPVLVINEDLHEDIRYLAVATAGNGDDEAVLAVLRLLAENEGLQTLFAGYGLVDRKTALIDD